jgi:hypothetical protein
LTFIQDGDQQIKVETFNPSNNDNVFFCYLEVNEPISVNEIELAPPVTLGVPVGATIKLTATVTESGAPVAGRLVKFSIDSGPNTGLVGVDTTDSMGPRVLQLCKLHDRSRHDKCDLRRFLRGDSGVQQRRR